MGDGREEGTQDRTAFSQSVSGRQIHAADAQTCWSGQNSTASQMQPSRNHSPSTARHRAPLSPSLSLCVWLGYWYKNRIACPSAPFLISTSSITSHHLCVHCTPIISSVQPVVRPFVARRILPYQCPVCPVPSVPSSRPSKTLPVCLSDDLSKRVLIHSTFTHTHTHTQRERGE
mmetsp:Transcript_21934/g.62448  ORF Transcript_21934/g.62448 Transcript_21934/m.62448 type:complete len:174 (+) Transcript_21934:561-1082(+)